MICVFLASKGLVEDNVLFSRDAPKWRPAIPVNVEIDQTRLGLNQPAALQRNPC